MDQNIEIESTNFEDRTENLDLSDTIQDMENLEIPGEVATKEDSQNLECETCKSKSEQSYFFTLYKKSGGLPDQNKRREVLLKDQRSRRNKVTDLCRGILTEDVEAEPDTSQRNTNFHRFKKYKNKLMLSEWLLEVPEDLDISWFLKVCPNGHRSLVVANKYKTKSYSRKGEFEKEFNSLLPGGNALENCHKGTILDCIWVPKKKLFYVLDVLMWSGQDLTEYDAEFRFFWLASRINETEELGKRSLNNTYPFIYVSQTSCDYTSILRAFETFSRYSNNIPVVDGALFYHREASYTSGRTPLVGWLKPYMIPEMLNIPIASEYYNYKPAKYVSLEKHIEYGNSQKNKYKKKDDSMEIEESKH